MQNIHDYRDIIDLPHPVSKKHPPMARKDRAAQFAPFAALTGHKEAVKERERQTESKRILSDGRKLLINEVLQKIKEQRKQRPVISVTYFVKDLYKTGGMYITEVRTMKDINELERQLICADGTKIWIPDIYQIELIDEKSEKE